VPWYVSTHPKRRRYVDPKKGTPIVIYLFVFI